MGLVGGEVRVGLVGDEFVGFFGLRMVRDMVCISRQGCWVLDGVVLVKFWVDRLGSFP